MTFVKLFRQSQLHGANRIGDDKISKFYRCAWIIALLILLWAAITVVCLTVRRYFDRPTYFKKLESFDNKMAFPSVILCPEVTFPDYKKEEFVSEIRLPSGLNASYVIKILDQLTAFYSSNVKYNLADLEILEQLLDFNELDLDTVARRLTSSCEEILFRCRLFGKKTDCSSLFEMEITGYGYCCIYNGRSLHREIREYGIHDVMVRDPVGTGKGLMTDQVGPRSGLIIGVNQSRVRENSNLPNKWISLQIGQSYVDTAFNRTVALIRGTELWAGFTTTGMRIEEEAKALHPELRNCRMSYERLKYFPIYDKYYCLLECEIAQTLARCQCLAVTHLPLPGVATCRAKDLPCVRRATVTYSNNTCGCMYTCDVDGDIIVKQKFDLISGTYTYDPFYQGLNLEEVTIVRVYMHTHGNDLAVRQPYFDSVQLFSQLGGVFSVFFGCSILTLLEFVQILYHGLQAAYRTIRARGRGNNVVRPFVYQKAKQKQVKNTTKF